MSRSFDVTVDLSMDHLLMHKEFKKRQQQTRIDIVYMRKKSLSKRTHLHAEGRKDSCEHIVRSTMHDLMLIVHIIYQHNEKARGGHDCSCSAFMQCTSFIKVKEAVKRGMCRGRVLLTLRDCVEGGI